jgi:hypothetical protein
MTADGVDYAWSHPGGAALQKAGIRFACRYASNDSSKDISKAEAADLAAHGVWTVVVWESTATRARAGRGAGITDATKAAARARAAGMPKGRPLYFAVDYDAPESDQAGIDAYFRGVASVIGVSRTGAYGGYWPLSRLKTAGLATWFWQTDAWSGSNRLAGRHIHQHAATVRIGGVSCDKNTALVTDFGQWMPGITPTPTPDIEEDTMAISGDDVRLIGRQVVTGANGMHAPDDPDTEWSVSAYLGAIYQQVTAQGAAITALAQQLGTGRDVDTIVTAVQEAIAQAVVHVDVDVTGTTPEPTTP